MVVRWKRSLCIALGGLLATFALSGCGGESCPEPRPLELATDYPNKPLPAEVLPKRSELSLPLNAWVDLPRMTRFIHDTVVADGVEGLVSKYQFYCAPRHSEVGCVDCYTCTRTIAKRTNSMWGLRSVCVDYGEVFVRASVGPGPAVRALTYWRISEDLFK